MYLLSIAALLFSFTVSAEDSNYHLKGLSHFTGSYEMTHEKVKYLLDIEEKERGKLTVRWRGKAPKVKSNRNTPLEFNYTTNYDRTRNTVTVQHKKEFTHAWKFEVLTGPSKGRYVRRTARGRDKVEIEWHFPSEGIIKIKVDLADRAYAQGGFGASAWYTYKSKSFYLKRIAH